VLSLFLAAWLPTAAPAPSIPFVVDDYRRALAEAKQRNLPLFVDAWAPWCHSCASMHAYVFTDPALREQENHFVWLSLNTERADNAAFLERFPVEVWPTLLVVDPKTREARARWVGTLTAAELVTRLRSITTQEPATPEGTPERLLRHAQAEEASGRRAEALELLRQSLALQPQGELRSEVVETLLNILSARSPRECSMLASGELPRISPGIRRMNVAASGLSCELAVRPVNVARLTEAETPVRQLLGNCNQALLADDCSALYQLLVESRHACSDAEGARKLSLEWAAFLDAQAQAASTPAARSVFDAHRVLAYEAAGTLERALPVLTQSERDFPHDYNPPARRATVLLKLGRTEEALAAAQRARALVYGPRTLQVMLVQAEALAKLGRQTDAQKTLRDADTLIARLPNGQRQASAWKLLDETRRRLCP
jgi:tetratricopeptide (TPR) repeat protein